MQRPEIGKMNRFLEGPQVLSSAEFAELARESETLRRHSSDASHAQVREQRRGQPVKRSVKRWRSVNCHDRLDNQLSQAGQVALWEEVRRQ